MRLSRAWLVGLSIAGVLLTSCGGPFASQPRPQAPASASGCWPQGRPTASAPAFPHRRVWLVTVAVLDRLVALPGTTQALAGAEVYALSAKGDAPTASLPGVEVIPTMRFTSELLLAQTLAQNLVPSDVRAIAYDNEDWPLTPPNERRDPIHYYRLAASLVHEHRLQFVATPGWLPGYHGVVTPASSSRLTAAQIVPAIAACVNVVDIQAQEYRMEADPRQYLAWVEPIARSARAASPSVTIVSGLSTNPQGGIVTSAQLLRVALASEAVVQGWWLNVPPIAHGRRGLQGYGVAQTFLAALGKSQG